MQARKTIFASIVLAAVAFLLSACTHAEASASGQLKYNIHTAITPPPPQNPLADSSRENKSVTVRS